MSLNQAGVAGAPEKRKGARQVWFGDGFVEAPVYDRYALVPGDRIEGPAIIEEREATTIVPPGDSLTVDANLNLRLAIGVAAPPQALVAQGTPLADAMARIEADPISLEIMWSRLVTVVDEMWLTVIRTAFSLIISEAQDFACELLDAERRAAGAFAARDAGVQPLPAARREGAAGEIPAETLVPGDVLVTNDPWLCAGHLFDIAVLTPVFRDGRLVGLVGTVGHVSDIGGTKDSLKAREIFEEGIQIPPMKLFRAGVPNEDLFTLLAENVRNPAQVLGDVHSFVAANAVGAERLIAFMSEYGIHDLEALAAVLQGRSEKAMREAIARDPGRRLHLRGLEQSARHAAALSGEAHRAGRHHRGRFRGRAAAAAAGRAQLHAQLLGLARDLSAQMHADAERARQCRLLPRVHREGARRAARSTATSRWR